MSNTLSYKMPDQEQSNALRPGPAESTPELLNSAGSADRWPSRDSQHDLPLRFTPRGLRPTRQGRPSRSTAPALGEPAWLRLKRAVEQEAELRTAVEEIARTRRDTALFAVRRNPSTGPR